MVMGFVICRGSVQQVGIVEKLVLEAVLVLEWHQVIDRTGK